MARTPFTLAALATSAVPGLDVFGTRSHTGSGDGAFLSAVLATAEGELIVRIPQTPAAEVVQSAEMLGLSALADGARAELPFSVPLTIGLTRAGETRAVVSTYLAGERIDGESLESDALLVQPIAEALVALHALPTSLVQAAGLPTRTAEEARVQVTRLVERAANTHLLPETVHRSWLKTLVTGPLWDFEPTVVHGSLSAEQLIVSDDAVTGILGWDALAVDDPAVDLAWLLVSGEDTFDAVLARYTANGGRGNSQDLRARAQLYHQLEVARWLLHGIETHDSAIVDDAVAMFDRLVDRLSYLGNSVSAPPPPIAGSVDQILDSVPDLPEDPRSETAEYEALDEDRAFVMDDEFTTPPPPDRAPSDP